MERDNINMRFCIIGAGFSGTAALYHFIKDLSSSSLINVEILIVEQQPICGPGYPYAPSNLLPSHLCNNQAKSMSLCDLDFLDWMRDSRELIVKNYPHYILETHPNIELNDWYPDSEAFYPRALFGIYLIDRFEETVKKAEQLGILVKVLNNCQAIDASLDGEKIDIKVFDHSTQDHILIDNIDKLLITTGHWVPNKSNNIFEESTYLPSPYPFTNLFDHMKVLTGSKAGNKKNIFVRGMGPSGIDAVMTLADQGDFIYSEGGHIIKYKPSSKNENLEIVAGSRSGFFPAVRGIELDYDFKYLTTDSFSELERVYGKTLGLRDIIYFIDKEIRAATSDLSWSDIIDPKFDNAYEKLKYDISNPDDNNLIHKIFLKVRRMKFYRHLNEKDKEIYDKEYDSYFIRIAVPIPLSNAEKLIALIESKKLSTISMGYKKEQNIHREKDGYKVFYDDNQEERSIIVSSIVDASGQNFQLTYHPSCLIQSLLKKGKLVPNKEGCYQTGGIMLDSNDSYRAMQQSKDRNNFLVSSHIYSFGILTRYWQNERNFSDAIVSAAKWISQEWVELHTDNVNYNLEKRRV